jgi:phosphatidate cytidylyltransferase
VGALLNRFVVAVPLAVAMLFALYTGGGLLTAVAILAAVLGLHELYSMARVHRPIVLVGQLGGVAIVAGAQWGGTAGALLPIPVIVLLAFLLAAAVGTRPSATVSVAVTVFGACYVGLGIAFVVLLREGGGDDQFGFDVALAVMLGVWISDIGAYFGGRAYGRRKLAPTISPGKTVEGAVTGIALGTAAVWFALYDRGIGSLEPLALGLVVCLIAPLGDLFESFLKRDLGVKDSGRLLGAHGGLLDRIDALLLAGPAAYLTLDLLGRV